MPISQELWLCCGVGARLESAQAFSNVLRRNR